MTKISQGYADTLAQRVTKKALADRRAELQKLEDEIVSTAYDHVVPAADRRIMSKLPDGYFTSTGSLQIEVAQYSYRRFSHSNKTFRMPDKFKNGISESLLTPEILSKIRQRNEEKGEIDLTDREITRSATAKIKAAGTIKRLVLAWPAIKDVLTPDELNPRAYALPALSFDDLDRMIARASPADAEARRIVSGKGSKNSARTVRKAA